MSGSVVTTDDLREKLNCSICLELFTMPVSIPCGHNFCSNCINEYWDWENKNQGGYTCPTCRKNFILRPEAHKNVSISDVVEVLKSAETHEATPDPDSLERRSRPHDSKCQKHNCNLELFCCTEHRCICIRCILEECQRHQLEPIEEKRQKEEAQLNSILLQNDSKKKEILTDIAKRQQNMESIKTTYDNMAVSIDGKFDQLRNILEECRTLSIDSLRKTEAEDLGQAEMSVQLLQNHLEKLDHLKKKAERLCQSDDVTFLQGLRFLIPPEDVPHLPEIPSCGSLQVDAVNKILPRVISLLQEEFPSALLNETLQDEATDFCSAEAAPSSGSPSKLSTRQGNDSFTMSHLREELYTDYHNLSFDPSSAYKCIRLSSQNRKAFHEERPQRTYTSDPSKQFQTWQTMCTEGISQGRHYWEVEISRFFVEIGVAYGCLERAMGEMNKIGRNPVSWSLQIYNRCHSAWHDNKEKRLQAAKYTTVGISLDYKAGTLMFYGIKDGSLELLHSFSCIFSGTLFPTFWIGENTGVELLQDNTGQGEGIITQ